MHIVRKQAGRAETADRHGQARVLRRFRLLLGGLFLALGLLLSFFFLRFGVDAARKAHGEMSTVALDKAAEALNLWIDGNWALIDVLAADANVLAAVERPEDAAVLDRAWHHLESFHKRIPYIMTVSLIAFNQQDTNSVLFRASSSRGAKDIRHGCIYLDTIDGQAVGIDVSRLDYFRMLENDMTRERYLGTPYRALSTGEPIFVFSRAIRKDGRIRAVMILAVHLDRFSDAIVSKMRIGKAGYMVMLGTDGRIMAHPNRTWIFTEKIPADVKRTILRVFAGESVFEAKLGDEMRAYIARRFNRGDMSDWFFAVSRSLDEINADALERFLWSLFGIAVILGAGLAAIWRMTSRSLFVPVARLIRGGESKFRAIFSESAQMMGLLAPDGTLLEANAASLRFAGTTADAVIGRPFHESPWFSRDPELSRHLRDLIGRAARGELVREELIHYAVDGTPHNIDFSLTPVFADDGSVEAIIPEGHDVTALRAQESELRERNAELERFEALVVGRELRMIELKARIAELEGRSAEKGGSDG